MEDKILFITPKHLNMSLQNVSKLIAKWERYTLFDEKVCSSILYQFYDCFFSITFIIYSRLISLSHGLVQPTQEIWAKAKFMEEERKSRIIRLPQPSNGAS